LTADQPTATASGFSVRITDVNRFVFQVFGCVGSASFCNSKPRSDTSVWTRIATGQSDDLPQVFTFQGLRSNTSHSSFSIKVADPESASIVTERNQAFSNLTTLPAYTPTTSTASNLQPDSATIAWTTAFSGVGRVRYGLQPPAWQTESVSMPTNDTLYKISPASASSAWAISYGGGLYQYTSSGWSAPTYPEAAPRRPLRSLDMLNATAGWAVGEEGAQASPIIVRTTNGSSWSVVAPGSSMTKPLYTVSTASPTTAWVAGSDEEIYFFGNSTWLTKTPSARVVGESLLSSWTNDNKLVLVGGTSARLFRTVDQGTTWNLVTLPGATDERIQSISSLDGQTIWAGGNRGGLWKSTDAGATWARTSLIPVSLDIFSLQSINQGDVMIHTSDAIYLYRQNAISSLPVAPIPSGGFISAAAILGNTDILMNAQQSTATYALVGSILDEPISAPSHTVQLSNLVAGGTYHYVAESLSGSIGGGVRGTFTLPQPDANPPVVSFSTPSAPSSVTRNVVFATAGTARDDVGLRTVTLTNNGTGQTVTVTPALATSPTNANWSASLTLTAGANVLVLTATDTSGNSATATATITLDTQNPTLVITAPVNGSTQNLTPITLSGTANDNSRINTMDYQLNGAGPVVVAPPAGGNGTWTTTIPSPVSGNNTVTVHAYDPAGNVATQTVTFTYAAPTFTVAASPSTAQSGPVGQTFNYTITAAPQNSFTGNVAFSAISVPSGMNAVFAPSTVSIGPANSTSNLILTTTGLNPGDYTVTVTGTSGARAISVPLTISLTTPPDFTLSASPNTPAPNIVAGNGGSYTVSVSANTTFDGTISLSSSGLPAGVTGSISPSSVSLAPNGSQSGIQFTIATQATTVPGNYSLTITGASGSLSHAITVPLNIIAPPDFSLTMAPASQSVAAGAPATFFSGSLEGLNGFVGTVDLTVTESGNTPGITMNLSRTSIALTATGNAVPFILNAQAGNQVPGGQYTLTITARSGSVTKATTVRLDVSEDGTAPTISNIVANPNFDRVTVNWETDEPATSSLAIYSDSARTVPVGVIGGSGVCSGNPCTHSLIYVPLTPVTTYYYTVTSVDQSPRANATTVTQQAGAPLQFTTLAAPDLTAPTLQVDSPAASLTPTQIIGQVLVSGSASDNQGLSQVTITISAQSGTWTAVNAPQSCSGTACTFSFTWTTDQSVPNGIYTIRVQAVDGAANTSPAIIRQVEVVNDFTAPQVLSGPEAVVAPTCGNGPCYATISWVTDDLATSEVDYGITITSCDPVTGRCTYPLRVDVDDTISSGVPGALLTTHRITLQNLDANQIYHYRITSCNGNGRCTN